MQVSGLLKIINQIHTDCHKLCFQALGEHLPVAGNIGVFCHSKNEYELFTKIRGELTYPSDNPNQKYFLLKEPIVIGSATYTHLYIRKPDPTPYGKYLGDVDFIMEEQEYSEFKNSVQNGLIKGAEIYDRPSWETVQITDQNINSVAYISTKEFSEKVRVKFD